MTKELNLGFQFKRFFVAHDKSAMKVGTDGVLLGSWAKITGKNILDLGTGTGLVALILAQRAEALNPQITAIELDFSAYQQAKENFQQSPWEKNFHIIHQDIFQFAQSTTQKFDCIVANPPYFQQALNCKNPERNQARYFNNQNHSSWLKVACDLLAEQGEITFILPFDAAQALVKTLENDTALYGSSLYCSKNCAVITKKGKSPQRALVSFCKIPCETQYSEFCIYDDQNKYTAEFKALTRDFYLNF